MGRQTSRATQNAQPLTVLDLVAAAFEVTPNERAACAVVRHLLATRVRRLQAAGEPRTSGIPSLLPPQ